MIIEAKDINGKLTKIKEATSGQKYYCPETGRLMYPRFPRNRRSHFYFAPDQSFVSHKKRSRSSHTFISNEGAWHSRMKELAVLSGYLPEQVSDNNRCDVRLGSVVFEFQHSPIDEKEFWDRSIYWRSQHCIVVWVFDQTSFEKPKRQGRLLVLPNEFSCLSSFLFSKLNACGVSRRDAFCDGVYIYYDVSRKAPGSHLIEIAELGKTTNQVVLTIEQISRKGFMTATALFDSYKPLTAKHHGFDATRKPIIIKVRYTMSTDIEEGEAIFCSHIIGRSLEGYLSTVINQSVIDYYCEEDDIESLDLINYLHNLDPILMFGDNTFVPSYEKGNTYVEGIDLKSLLPILARFKDSKANKVAVKTLGCWGSSFWQLVDAHEYGII